MTPFQPRQAAGGAFLHPERQRAVAWRPLAQMFWFWIDSSLTKADRISAARRESEGDTQLRRSVSTAALMNINGRQRAPLYGVVEGSG